LGKKPELIKRYGGIGERWNWGEKGGKERVNLFEIKDRGGRPKKQT